jgi:ADP-ribose pyrophosphatase YjhB (NUDIX family)
MSQADIKVFVTALCHDGMGNYLMARRGPKARDRVGYWEFGGGTVEFGETFEQTLVREMEEEFDVIPFALQQLAARDFINDTSHWVGIFYRGQVDRHSVKIMEPVHETIDWFRLDSLPEPMIPGDREWILSCSNHFD